MRILIFSAHPDDAEFALGGTLLALKEKHVLHVVTLTDGGGGSFGNASERREEQLQAAKLLGATVEWFDIPDCHLEYTRANALRVANKIREWRPDVVFVPHWDLHGDIHEGKAHPDHRAAGLLVRDAARFARFKAQGLNGEPHAVQALLYYMVPAHRPAKLFVPVRDVAALRALFHAHKSQMQLRGGAVEEHLLSERKHAARVYPGIAYGEELDCDRALTPHLVHELFN